jgi:hypothetical protein
MISRLRSLLDIRDRPSRVWFRDIAAVLLVYGSLMGLLEWSLSGSLYSPWATIEWTVPTVAEPAKAFFDAWLSSAAAPQVWEINIVHPVIDWPLQFTYVLSAVVVALPLYASLALLFVVFYMGTIIAMLAAAVLWGLTPVWLPALILYKMFARDDD